MSADQQIGGPRDVAIGEHSGSTPLGSALALGDLVSAARGVSIATKIPYPGEFYRAIKASPYRP
jgi:hypothetical protein